MREDISRIIEQFVDFLMPELTPHEASLYVYFLRNTFLKSGGREFRIGKRTIAENYAKGSRGKKTNYAHITKLIKGLEQKGCIEIGDANREGTLYKILLPEHISLVREKLAVAKEPEEEDYFNNENKRKQLFERDKWTCCYCGEKVTKKNATLDHLIPQNKGGKHTKNNLKTCCFIYNSIKSGKTYEEAAPFLLKSIRDRKAKVLS